MKIKVLFVCVRNSARGQMAEAFLNHLYGNMFEAHSAGLEPVTINPIAVDAMWELGVDISENNTKWVFDYIKIGLVFDYVITVCDETNARRCPNLPGAAVRLHWTVPDPALFAGTPENKLARMREARDAIREKVQQWGDDVSCLKKT